MRATVLPARTSVGLWLIPVLVAVMSWWSYQDFGHFGVPAYWPAHVAVALDGMMLGAPLSAAAAAWEGSRARASGELSRTVRVRLGIRLYFVRTWAIYLALALGVVGALIVSLLTSPPPVVGAFPVAMLLPSAGAAFVAVTCGYLIGRFLPLPVSLPLALILMYQWVAYPGTDGNNVSWRHITGYWVSWCCYTPGEVIDPVAVVAPVVLSIGLVPLLLVAAARRLRMWACLAAAPALVASTVVALTMVQGLPVSPSIPRAAGELDCTSVDTQVDVCLWPEQVAASSALRGWLGEDWTRTEQVVALPSRLSAAQVEAADTGSLFVDLPVGGSRDVAAAAFAEAAVTWLACIERGGPQPSVNDVPVSFALAVGLGADPTVVTPTIVVAGDATSPGLPLSTDDVMQRIGITDSSTAMSVFSGWATTSIRKCGGK